MATSGKPVPKPRMDDVRKKALTEWFREADKDGNGFLSRKEFKKSLKKQGYRMSGKHMKALFKEMDTDGDKKVTREECMIFMGQIPDVCHKEAKLRAAFEKADANKDGILDFQEMTAIAKTLNMTDPGEIFNLMAKIDKTASGKIEYNKFLDYFLRQNAIDIS